MQASYTACQVWLRKQNQLCSGTICGNTHKIISSMVPHEFNVILSTTDEWKVLPRIQYPKMTIEITLVNESVTKGLLYTIIMLLLRTATNSWFHGSFKLNFIFNIWGGAKFTQKLLCRPEFNCEAWSPNKIWISSAGNKEKINHIGHGPEKIQ